MENPEQVAQAAKTTTINLIQLLVEELRRIKLLLLCGCILALLMGAMKYVDSSQEAEAPDAEELMEAEQPALDPTARAQYEKVLETYRLQKSIYEQQIADAEAQIAEIGAQIADNKAVRESSVLLSMDPGALCQKDGVWYVDAHYQIHTDRTMQDPDPTDSIVGAYAALMTSRELYAQVARVTGEDIATLERLISVDASEGALLRLTVVADSAERASKIYAASKDYLTGRQEQVVRSVTAHDLTLVEESAAPVAAESMRAETFIQAQEEFAQAQETLQSQQAALQNTIWDLRTKLSQLEEAQLQRTLTAQQQDQQWNAQNGQSKDEITPETIMKGALKQAFIGFFAGLMLAGIYVGCVFVAKDAALDEEDIRRRFGVSILASVRRFTGMGKWQQMLSRLSGDEKRVASPEAAAALAQSNIVSFLDASGHTGERVLLVGREADKLGEMARLIGQNVKDSDIVTAGGNIMADTAAVDTLRNYENVVLVESKERTRYAEIGAEVERLLLLKKNVVGLIAL